MPARALRLVATALGVLLVLSGCMIPVPTVQPLTVIDPVDEAQQVPLGDAQRATVRLRLLSRELVVRAGAGAALLSGRFRYNVAEWAPKVKQEIDGETLRVTVGQGLGSQIPLGKHDEYANTWDIELARTVPLDLGVDMGTGTANLDLTGLALDKLSVTSGSTDLSVAFGLPNPQPLGSLKLTTATGKVVATGLGNANFDTLSVLGGTGPVDLDFSGSFHRSALADIKAGAGAVTVRVPANLGVRVTVTGVLPVGKVDLVGFSEAGEDVYVNAAYGDAPLTLTVKITTGIGSISLISQ
jgi:hypothetical protein